MAAQTGDLEFQKRPMILRKLNQIRLDQTGVIYDSGFTIYARMVSAKTVVGSEGFAQADGLQVTDLRSWSDLQFEERPMKAQKLNQIRPDQTAQSVAGDGWQVAGFGAQGTKSSAQGFGSQRP